MNNQLIIANQPKSVMTLVKEAMAETKIKESTPEDLAMAISSAVEQAFFYLGLNKSESDRDATKIIVMEDCFNSFQSLSIGEVKIAIHDGVRGHYGEVRGIAPKDIYHWISAYKTSEIRKKLIQEAMYAHKNDDDGYYKMPTQAEKIQLAKYTLEQAWVKFKETGAYSDHGNTVYNILDDNGKIRLTKEEKLICLERAKAYLFNYYAPEKHLGNDIKLKEVLKIYNEIKASDSNIRVKSQAKQFALLMVFEQMKKENIEIYDLFD